MLTHVECVTPKAKLMLKSSVCGYRDVYILAKRTITVPDTVVPPAAANNDNVEMVFKNCAPFADCKREINSTQIDHAKGIVVIMLMYNLIEYRI